jgi:uncharacterized protein YutE (UPF0331/DUF86 family)
MTPLSPTELNEIASDLKIELDQLSQLTAEIQKTQELSYQQPDLSQVFCESLALKLHNFYTGCERIFKIIASEFNGGLPSSYNWHQRLLNRMTTVQNYRPAVISQETAIRLKEYLNFRHVVRNIYGFELDSNRVAELVNDYYSVWESFSQELNEFIEWLQNLATEF